MYQLNPYLRKHWTTKARNKLLLGGRASSKSHDAGGMATHLAANFTLKFMCVRRFQNKITDSVYTLLCEKIDDSEYKDEFSILNNSIVHKRTKSEFLFYGLERNIEEIKSTEGVDILWIEEGHSLTSDQWKILEPTIRKDDSEIWIVANPDLITDFIWQYFVVGKPDDTIVTFINYDNNPFLSKTMLKVIENARKKMTPEEFDHVYGGQPRTTDDESFIPMKFLLACRDAHIKLNWPDQNVSRDRQIGFDLADKGEDLNAAVTRIGRVIRGCITWRGMEDKLLQSCSKVHRMAVETDAIINYDSIGVGATAGSKFSEMNDERNGQGLSSVEYHAFNAKSKIPRPDDVYLELPHKDILRGEHLENAKAAGWDRLAQWARNTFEAVEYGVQHPVDEMISFDSSMPTIEALFLELATPKKAESATGKLMVERKQDLKKRGIKSPNMADACVMSVAEIEYTSAGVLDHDDE